MCCSKLDEETANERLRWIFSREIRDRFSMRCGGVCFIQHAFPIARGTLAALCVMPVPSVVVQQAVKNNMDADLAASLVSGSQIASVVMLLFLAVMNLASRPFLFSVLFVDLSRHRCFGGVFLGRYLSPNPHNV